MTRQCALHGCIHPAVNHLELVTGVRVWVCNPHKYSFSKVTVRFLTLIAALLLGFGPVAAQCKKPVITNAVGTPSATQITFTWSTDVLSDSLVGYGVQNPGTFTPVLDTMLGVTNHSVTVTGLQPNTPYGWGVRSHMVGCPASDVAYFGGPGDVKAITTSAPPPGPFTYEIVPIGPTNITQGYGMYFKIELVPLTGTYTVKSLTMNLSGLPAGTSVLWPDTQYWNVDVDIPSTTTVPNDTLLLHAFNYKEVYVKASTATPPGNYTITITVSGSGGPTVVATWPLNVVPSTAPFSGVPLPSNVPQSYPPIPNLTEYVSNAVTYGVQNCAQDFQQPRTIRANIPPFTPVAPCCTYSSWDYDGVMGYYGIENLAKNGMNWEQCRTNIKQVYLDGYALKPAPIQTFMEYSEGAYLDYLKNADPADLQLLTKFGTGLQYWFLGDYVDVSYLQREVSYVARNLTHLVALGGNVNNPFGQSSAFMRDYAEEHVLGMLDQICLSKNAQYWENFMIGLQADALLQYYLLANRDPRIPPALACVADYLYANQWQAIDTGSFPYDKYQWIVGFNKANGSTSCQGVLNNLISPIYAWLFKETGLQQYQVEGDQIFSAGVLLTECGGPRSQFLGAAGSDGKFFMQNYYLGTMYPIWRSPQQPQPSTMWPVSSGGTLQ